MRSVLISIQPKWCELIASGKKIVEVRTTKPNRPTPFKCYIYCTKQRVNGEILLTYDKKIEGRNRGFREDGDIPLAGKVIGEFDCVDVLNFTLDPYGHHEYFISDDDIKASCLTHEDLWNYGKGKTLYGWCISNLVIYEKPKELCEFEKPWCDTNGKWKDIRPCECGECCKYEYFDYSENTVACGIDFDGENCPYTKIQKAPQSWCYVGWYNNA